MSEDIVSIQARATRLTHLRGSPGFPDLMRIMRELAQEPTDAMLNFEGWDKDQISVLKARAQAANEVVKAIMQRIDSGIAEGILVQDNGRAVTERADEMRGDYGRIAGSY